MYNPYAWAVLSVCTIAALVFGIYTWFSGKKKKEFSCYRNSYPIIKAGKSLIPELQLHYRGKEIEDLVVTKYAIWNSGNEVVNQADMVTSKPLQVFSNDAITKILDVKIIEQNEETNGFEIAEQSEQSASIKFDYVGVKEGIILQIIHTGKPNALMIGGKIKGGKKIKSTNKEMRQFDYKKTKKRLLATAIIAFVICMAMLAIVVVDICNMVLNAVPLSAFSSDPSILISGGATLLAVFAEYYLCLRVLKTVYHIDIPAGIRNGIEYDEFEEV